MRRRLPGLGTGVAYALSVVLAVPWIWLTLESKSRDAAIAWLALTAGIGALWCVAGARSITTGTSPAARWGGFVSLLVGAGMVGLAIMMLPIGYASTWAV